jgi:hypothetical protein
MLSEECNFLRVDLDIGRGFGLLYDFFSTREVPPLFLSEILSNWGSVCASEIVDRVGKFLSDIDLTVRIRDLEMIFTVCPESAVGNVT